MEIVWEINFKFFMKNSTEFSAETQFSMEKNVREIDGKKVNVGANWYLKNRRNVREPMESPRIGSVAAVVVPQRRLAGQVSI
jgi:hypothetical protein